MDKLRLKKKAIELRKKGKTYSEIKENLGKNIPKSTISYWLKRVPLAHRYKERIRKITLNNIKRAQLLAILANKSKRELYLEKIKNRNKHLVNLLDNKDVAKIALAMLYLGEGSKNLKRGSLMFGNSDPYIINLFVRLLRFSYSINESKFRCTLQCRADQNIKDLEKFWSKITEIPLRRFYKARIDPRTKRKPSKKSDYKGVCRIDYFSAELLIELTCISKIVCNGPIA